MFCFLVCLTRKNKQDRSCTYRYEVCKIIGSEYLDKNFKLINQSSVFLINHIQRYREDIHIVTSQND
jgi:hypothetical protein